MTFNISNGLSEMGKTIASTAGDVLLTAQRADLERERLELAESLAEGREIRGRVQAADIADKASTKDQNFRAGESLLNRGHEDSMLNTREAGDDKRAKLSADTQIAVHNSSEASADTRFNKEMQFKIDQAKEAVKDKTQQRILDGVIAASTTTVEQPYTTAAGEQATRPVKVFNPVKAAGLLRDSGHEDLAKPFFTPKAKAADKAADAPIEGSVVKQGGHTFKVVGGKYIPQE